MNTSLRSCLLRAVGNALLWTGVFAVGAWLVLLQPTDLRMVPPVAPATNETPKVVQMMDKHSCWSKIAPPEMAGRIPGHAVLTLPGKTQPIYSGDPEMVGKAMDQALGNAAHGLTIHGFCS